MMAARIYARVLTAEELQALVEKLRPHAPYAVLERVDDIDFPASDEAIDPTAWDEGRVFGSGLELHWSREGENFRTVLTREDSGDGEGLPEVESLNEAYKREEHAYYLWGEEDTRIGRRMDYRAIPGKGRAQLVVAEFYDERSDLHHWRYIRFQREGS
jgi:hypothetical protein